MEYECFLKAVLIRESRMSASENRNMTLCGLKGPWKHTNCISGSPEYASFSLTKRQG